MIVSPDWTTLRGFAVGLNAEDPVERKRAIERTLRLIAEELPDVEAVRLYSLDDGTLLIRAATDKPEKAAVPLTPNSSIAACIRDQKTLWDAKTKQWVSCLHAGDYIVGVLEVLVDELDDDWLVWLGVIAEQVATSLALSEMPQATLTPSLDDIQVRTQKLVIASRMLLVADAEDEIATAAMYVAGANIIGVMVTLFEQSLSIQPAAGDATADNRRYVGAVATRESVELLDQNESISSLPEKSYLDSLRQEIPIIIEDVETDAGYLSGWMREQIIALNANQVTVFGLTSGTQIVGTLELLADKPHTLTQQDIDLYAAIANQIGNTLLGKRLLRQSQQSQQFATQLVNTNKAIAVAVTYEDMARAVLNDAPDDIQTVAIALFNRPFTLMGSPSRLDTKAIVTREQTIPVLPSDDFSAVDDARVVYFLHEYLEGRMMLLWSITRPRRPVMAETLVNTLMQDDMNMVTSFGLNMGVSLRGLLVFGSTGDLREPGPRYNGLRALADQLAAVIENRILLENANENLDLIQSQYEVSSRVFRTNDLPQILRAVYDFAGGVFSSAHLATVTPDNQVHIIAEADAATSRAVSRLAWLDDYPASQTLSVLEALEVRSVADDVFISEEERVRLQEQGIGSLVILPILSNDALSGLIVLTNENATRIKPDRLRAMRSIADHVGVVIENQSLMQSTEDNLLEMQALYTANTALPHTQSRLDVFRVLKDHLAPDASVVCQLCIQYDPPGRKRIHQVLLNHTLTDDGGHSLYEPLPTTDSDLEDIERYLGQLNQNVIFAPKGNPVPGNPVRLLTHRYTFESYAALIIWHQGTPPRVSDLILLLFDHEKPFPESTRRLYEAVSGQVQVAIENQTLLYDLQQTRSAIKTQSTALNMLDAFSQRVNSGAIRNYDNEEALLKDGLKTLVEATGVDHGSMVFINEDLQTGIVIAEHPETDYMGATVSMAGNPLLSVGYDPAAGVVITDDVEHAPQLRADMQRNLLDVNARSIALLPLVDLSGNVMGSIALNYADAARTFSREAIQVAQVLARQISIALQTLRLQRDAQQRAGQLQSITDFSHTAQATLNLTDMVRKALASVPGLISVTHITVTLYDDQTERLVLMGGWQEVNNERQPIEGGVIVPRDGTTTGYVFETGRHLYLPELTGEAGLAYPQANNINSLLAMPLINGGRTLGVMTVGANQPDAYTDTDVALFQQMVNQMAVAIDNARAYTQSQRIAQNKTFANEISVELQRQSEISSMIDLTMKEVGRAIGAKRGRIRMRRSRPQDSDNGN